MKLRIIVPLIISIVMMIGSAGVVWGNSVTGLIGSMKEETDMRLSRIDAIASSLYQAAYANNRQAAYLYVQQLQLIIDRQREADHAGGWALLAKDAEAIKRMLQSEAAGASWTEEAARIRLAADALSRPEQALWLQYETVMLDDLSRVQKAWKRQTGDGAAAARAAMKSLQLHAERIEPAFLLLQGSVQGAELKERIKYTNQLLESTRRTTATDQMIDQSLTALKNTIAHLYSKTGYQESLPAVAPLAAANPLGWTLFLGAIISAVLAYSGWRKYKEEPYGIKPIS